MPGIVGIIAEPHFAEGESHLATMLSAMRHDKAYRSSTHCAPASGVFAGVIGLNSGTARVAKDLESQNVLLFSGEACLGSALAPASSADLLAAYNASGPEFVKALNGLFSGVLIDSRNRSVLLFNDRYGMDRVYVAEFEDRIYFASEAKALLRVLPHLRAFDDEGLTQLLTFGSTLEDRTFFRGVSLLPAGTIWKFQEGEVVKRRYFSPKEWEAQEPLSPEAFEEQFGATFSRILPRYLQNAGDIGIAITGGLDTRLIMACLPKLDGTPLCYTYAGREGLTLDARLGAEIAKACGLKHHLLRVGPDFFEEFSQLADKTVYATDGYFGITGTHELYMNAAASRLAPIRLTGNYGGEIYRGISTFKPLKLAEELFAPELRNPISACGEKLIPYRANPVTFGAFCETPWNIFGVLAAGRSQVAFRTPYLDNELVALGYRTPTSLFGSRTPGFNIVRRGNPLLAQIPTDMAETMDGSGVAGIFRKLSAKITFKLDYYNNEGLPHRLARFEPAFKKVNARLGLVGLHKHLHYRSWLRQELATYLREKVSDSISMGANIWNRNFLRDLAEAHISGRKNLVQEINTVLTVEAIERLLFRELPRNLLPPEAARKEEFATAI